MPKLGDIKGESNRGFLDLGKHRGTSKYTEIEWTLYPGPGELVKSVRAAHPQGVDGILIGLNKLPGYAVTVGPNGIIAILIGLLLPAVQKMEAGSSADLRLLSGVLDPQGQVAFAMGDGSVRIAGVDEGLILPGGWLDVLPVGLRSPGTLAMKSI